MRYHAIADDLTQRIASGEYAPGMLLPSVRDLMAGRVVGKPMANKTAENALKELVRRGLARAIPQVGYIVAGPPSATSTEERVDRLTTEQAQLRADVDEIRRHLGLESGA